MPNFVLTYLGGKRPESPEAGAAHMEQWKAWVVGLGESMINPGTPLGKAKMVSSTGVSDDDGADRLTGFSIVSADSLDDAVAIAKKCPFLDVEGTIGVAEAMQMPS